jgi:hypothetical protein
VACVRGVLGRLFARARACACVPAKQLHARVPSASPEDSGVRVLPCQVSWAPTAPAGSRAPSAGSGFVLHTAALTVRRGETCVVVGQVGSGYVGPQL